MTILYGLKNCDSCRKARRWLDEHGVDYRFHDVRDDGLDAATLAQFFAGAEWKVLLNTRSTTWRSLPESQKKEIDADRAMALILEHPTLLKRPVLADDAGILSGFSPQRYAERLS